MFNAFLVVSNGDSARYGSISSAWEHFGEWKRLEEKDKGSVDAEVLLNGMLAKDRLLDLIENFILFDGSKPGTVRKVMARNHQVLGVNLAVAAAAKQEALKLPLITDPDINKLITSEAIRTQACLLAGIDLEDIGFN